MTTNKTTYMKTAELFRDFADAAQAQANHVKVAAAKTLEEKGRDLMSAMNKVAEEQKKADTDTPGKSTETDNTGIIKEEQSGTPESQTTDPKKAWLASLKATLGDMQKQTTGSENKVTDGGMAVDKVAQVSDLPSQQSKIDPPKGTDADVGTANVDGSGDMEDIKGKQTTMPTPFSNALAWYNANKHGVQNRDKQAQAKQAAEGGGDAKPKDVTTDVNKMTNSQIDHMGETDAGGATSGHGKMDDAGIPNTGGDAGGDAGGADGGGNSGGGAGGGTGAGNGFLASLQGAGSNALASLRDTTGMSNSQLGYAGAALGGAAIAGGAAAAYLARKRKQRLGLKAASEQLQQLSDLELIGLLAVKQAQDEELAMAEAAAAGGEGGEGAPLSEDEIMAEFTANPATDDEITEAIDECLARGEITEEAAMAILDDIAAAEGGEGGGGEGGETSDMSGEEIAQIVDANIQAGQITPEEGQIIMDEVIQMEAAEEEAGVADAGGGDPAAAPAEPAAPADPMGGLIEGIPADLQPDELGAALDEAVAEGKCSPEQAEAIMQSVGTAELGDAGAAMA